MTDERSVTMTEQGEAPALQAPGRIHDQPCADCLDQPPAAERTRPAVPRRIAFWLLAMRQDKISRWYGRRDGYSGTPVCLTGHRYGE